METKSLLIGITSFIAGALLVSIAAVTFEKDEMPAARPAAMTSAADSLAGKSGDDFDKAFIAEMIVHHQGAIDMAKLANSQAEHSEVKDLSKAIIAAQEKEIGEMKQWQTDWGYGGTESESHPTH